MFANIKPKEKNEIIIKYLNINSDNVINVQEKIN